MTRHPAIGEVRGRGLMIGVELVEDRATKKPAKQLAEDVVERAFRNGLLLLTCGSHGQVVRIIPPMVTTDDEVELALGISGEALDAIGA